MLALAWVAFAPSPVRAQCDDDDFAVRASTPASGARDVPINAYLRIDYPRCYFSLTGQDPITSLALEDENGVPVAGRITLGDDQTLFFLPDSPLAPNTSYAFFAGDFEGGFEGAFTTTESEDTEPPRFGEIEQTSSARIPDPTDEAPEGGWRVDVSFQPAVDDGAAGSIEYLLYLTRGPTDLEAPELRARSRNFATGVITMAFVLTDEEASDPICVVVHAVDGLGRVDDDQEPFCFEPIQGSFFDGCAAGGTSAPIWVAAFALLLRRRRL
ncbi:MAG: Ig-like domain-containing protein [Myxococcota bacterium]